MIMVKSWNSTVQLILKQEAEPGTSKKKVKGTIHWVSAKHAVNAEVRLYDRLFTVEAPDADKEKSFLEF